MARQKSVDEESYKFFFENAPIGILQADTSGRILSINPYLASLVALRTTGRSRIQNIAILKETRFAADFSHAVKSGETVIAECDIPRKKLRLRYYFLPILDNAAAPSRKGTALLGARGIVVDITARKKAEAEINRLSGYFDSLVSSMSPVITLDAKGKIRFANPAFTQEFQPGSADIIGKGLLEVLELSAADRARMRRDLRQARPDLDRHSEFRLGERTFGYTLFRFRDDVGIILKNITDVKRLEERVQQLHSQLLQLQESERQRIAAELHDSVGQTILAAKINLVASGPSGSERFQTGLELIDQASQQLREIYTNLYPSVLRDLGLEAAVRSLVKGLFGPDTAASSLHFDIRRKPPHAIEVNVFRMVQEILANVTKHAGATRVTLSLVRGDRALVLEIQDDGRGFDPKHTASSGFGLDNLRRRAKDMHGDFRIASKRGRGTTVKVRIPMSDAQ